jgi:hypothetical protein
MTTNMAELWKDPGNVNEWGSVKIPDSPEGIHDEPSRPDPTESQPQPAGMEAVTHLGGTALGDKRELVPVGPQEVGPEVFYG